MKKKAKIEIIQKKPSVKINPDWFPYRNIVNKKEYEKICHIIEMIIENRGVNSIKVFYEVIWTDENNNPLEIHITTNTKVGFLSENEGIYILSTIFDK